jgi:hypothetical protein
MMALDIELGTYTTGGAGMNELRIVSSGESDGMSTVSSRPVVTPQVVHIDMEDERIQDVIGRVQRAIQSTYTDAEFVSYIGTNPLGIYVEVYTNEDHFIGILRLLDDKLGNLHIAAGVDICVVPRRKAQVQAA